MTRQKLTKWLIIYGIPAVLAVVVVVSALLLNASNASRNAYTPQPMTAAPTLSATARPSAAAPSPVPTPSRTPAPTPTHAPTPSPTRKLPLAGKYIGINAGHQLHLDSGLEPLSPEAGSPKKAKISGGAVGVVTGKYEYEINLSVALKVQKMLEGLGARVLMVRTTNDVRISNVERCKMMNDAGVQVYLSLHCNGNDNRSISGLETLVPAKRGYQTGAVLKQSQRLANCMQTNEIKSTGAKDDGYSTRGDLSGLNWSKMPTCMIEMGYMSNAAEDRLLATDDYQQKLAQGIVDGFLEYFNTDAESVDP